MENYDYKVQLGQDKARNEQELQALQRAMGANRSQVRSLMISMDSLHGLASQQKLLELSCLSLLENLVLNFGYSLGATGLGILAQVIEARHIPLLTHLNISYLLVKEQERQHSRCSSTSQQNRSSSSSSSFSLSGSGGRSGGYSSSSSVTKSQTDSCQFGNHRQGVTVSWEGFALLARVLRKNLLPRLDKTISINSNWGSRNLGDVGVKHLAELIATGYISDLKDLDLEDNLIGSAGMGALAEALRRGNMAALEVLNVSKNVFQPSVTGILEVVKVLEANYLPQLKWIGLSGAGHQTIANGSSVADEIVAAFTRNTSLTTFVHIDWPDKRLQGRWNVVLERNVRVTRILQKLGGQEEVSVTNGKIFICGFPGRGKTTLRASLKRSSFGAFIRQERKLRHQKPTRGIEVTKITETFRHDSHRTKFSLTLWDLAGLEDFQVLHSSFLPDLGLANGRGTTFVVVFDARYNRSPIESASAEDELVYWLRFIASNSIVGLKRKVLVVLNTFNGASCMEKAQWTELLKWQREKYEDVLDITIDPFVLDARVAKSVSQLKQALFQYTRSALRNVRWPKICQYIQENLEVWSSENHNFPIIDWGDFEGKLAASKLDPENLEAAVECLHESGGLIYFRRGSLTEGGSADTKLIVLNPQWFCKRVVGQLLLPDGMLDAGETPLKRSVAPDGSLGIREIKAYFKELLTRGHQVNYVVGMLLRLGLCYKVGQDRVLIPALIEDDELPSKIWKREPEQQYSSHWVMGRSLALKDSERTALPKAVFRRLQVQLAQDPELGGVMNSDYAVGKSYLTFKKNGMSILVQFDVNENDPRDDRVDLVSKPLVRRDKDLLTQRKQQIDLVEQVMTRLQLLCLRWCPGLQFVEKAILPWRASDGVLPILERNAQLPLDDIKMWLKQNWLRAHVEDYSNLNWVVGEDAVMEAELLSSSEIHELQLWAEAESCDLKQLVIDLEILPESSSPLQECSMKNTSSTGSHDATPEMLKRTESPGLEQNSPLHLKMEREAQGIRNYIDKTNFESRQHLELRLNEVIEKTTEVGDHFRKTSNIQQEVLRQIQGLQRFSIEELQSSIPRFMFLAEKERSGVWLTMQQAFVERRSKLHLLCEARYNDGVLHEVEGQKGLEITQFKEWASMLAPWLERSLKAAIVAAKIAGGILIPGLHLLIPDFQNKSGQSLTFLISTDIVNINFAASVTDSRNSSLALHADKGNSVSAGSPSEINAKAKFILQKLLGDKINAPIGLGISEYFGLQRVVLTDPHDSTQSSIFWLCGPCCRKYGRLARDIS